MPHRVSPRLTVSSVGAEGLIMSAVGAGAGPALADCASAWMAASVAVSSGSAATAGELSATGAVASSAGAERGNSVAQPLIEIAAATRVTVNADLEAWL